MKRAEHLSLLDADDGETPNRAHCVKRVRLGVSPSPASRRSSMLLHSRSECGSDGLTEPEVVTASEQSDRLLLSVVNRPRAQSDPPKGTTNVTYVRGDVPLTLLGLSQKAVKLNRKQQEHMVNAERLQQRLTTGEQALGEHLRESLKIQRAIQQRREQNRVDRQQLEQERVAAKSTADDLDQVLQEMQAFAERTRT